MKYELQDMSGERAKAILQDLLNDLQHIDESEMTTFELNFIRCCATVPPQYCWPPKEDQ